MRQGDPRRQQAQPIRPYIEPASPSPAHALPPLFGGLRLSRATARHGAQPCAIRGTPPPRQGHLPRPVHNPRRSRCADSPPRADGAPRRADGTVGTVAKPELECSSDGRAATRIDTRHPPAPATWTICSLKAVGRTTQSRARSARPSGQPPSPAPTTSTPDRATARHNLPGGASRGAPCRSPEMTRRADSQPPQWGASCALQGGGISPPSCAGRARQRPWRACPLRCRSWRSAPGVPGAR